MARDARSKVKVKVKVEVEVEVKDRLVSPKRSNRDPAPSTPQHAAHRYHTVLMIVGAVMLSLCGLLVLGIQSNPKLYEIVVAVLSFLFGGALLSLGWRGRQLGNGVQTVNISFDLIARGHLVEAEKRLDSIDAATASSLIECVATIQRGLIALRRGDAATGLKHLDHAVAVKPGLLYRASVRVQTVNALGIRAFLRAVTGDRDGARADAKALHESPEALPQSLARAALAEAICLEKEGDRYALRRHLQTHHDLLFDVTDRRERAIVRAFQRMLETTATSVYRQGAKLDMQGDDPPLVDWIAQLVPSAAPFVEAKLPQNVTNELPPPVATEDGKKAVSEARKIAGKEVQPNRTRQLGAVALWGVLVGSFIAIWRLYIDPPLAYIEDEMGHDMVAPWSLSDWLPILGATYLATLGALLGRRVWHSFRAKQETRDVVAAMNLCAQGKLDAAQQSLTPLAASQYAFVKAQAHLALAQIFERRADLSAALDHCDRGIGSLSRYVLRISASDILLPDLMAQRAFVLAAMDRYDEAEAELEALPQAYPYRSRALLRVRLVSLVRRGDLDGAARLAAETDLDLPLTARDELLADGVRVAVHPGALGAGELPRIRRELRTVTSLRPWLASVAPKALEAIERAADEVPSPSTDDRDQAAEAEARAEDEAAREEVALRRAQATS
jgi:hypothetical protein